MRRSEPRPALAECDAARLVEGLRRLVSAQSNFARTGGVHAASLLTEAGERLATFEDIGRHNAVDKVVGDRLLRERTDCDGLFLCVSGRASFEIVQKAVVARCAGVVSVSAPSSLAVATAARFNLALIGFARQEAFNVYVGREVPAARI